MSTAFQITAVLGPGQGRYGRLGTTGLAYGARLGKWHTICDQTVLLLQSVCTEAASASLPGIVCAAGHAVQEAAQTTAYTELQHTAGKSSNVMLLVPVCLGSQLLPHCTSLSQLQILACASPAAAAGLLAQLTAQAAALLLLSAHPVGPQ